MTYDSAYSHLPDPEMQPAFYEGVTLKRGVAFLVDAVLIALVSALVVPFTAFTGIFFFPALMAVVGFVYRVATIAGGSATLGMRLMAIEFRDANGARFDGGQALLHTAGFYFSCAVAPLQLVSVLMMLLTPRGQGLTDMVLSSVALNKRA